MRLEEVKRDARKGNPDLMPALDIFTGNSNVEEITKVVPWFSGSLTCSVCHTIFNKIIDIDTGDDGCSICENCLNKMLQELKSQE
jgi:hypothetical protein